MAEPANLPQNTNLEKFAKHHKGVFNSLRQTIKKEASMFLFGQTRDATLKLIMKLYHENILRNLSEKSANKGAAKLSCMFGILQADDDSLYVTISESPGMEAIGNTTTDPNYLYKKAMVINLLKSANIDVKYPESDMGIPGAIPPPVLSEANLWRKGPAAGESDVIADAVNIRKKINENEELKNSMFFYDANKPETNTKDNVNLYSPEIRAMSCLADDPESKCTVNWIDSVEYLQRRAAHGPTFPPFKKYSYDAPNPTWRAECNNGHLCTESKLFAYVKINNTTPGRPEIRPVTFVAYWINNGLPPHNHIIRNYCYRTNVKAGDTQSEIDEETRSLQKLTQEIKQIIKAPASLQAKGNYDEVLMRMIQPVAVACPGCFANVQAYKNGRMIAWDDSNCYMPRRHNAALVGGKSRRRKVSKKAKKTRRRGKSRK